MLSLIFRKCVLCTQMRRFSTALVYNKNQNKRNVEYWSDLKCVKSASTNVTTCRPFSSQSDKTLILPSLMNAPLYTHVSIFAWLKIFYRSIIVQQTVDKEFSLKEFVIGSNHAIKVISNALAAQRYEVLKDLVQEKTLKILKQNVDCLTPLQRKLIAVDERYIINNCPVTLEIIDEGDEKIIEISQVTLYFHCSDVNVNVNKYMSRNADLKKIRIFFCNYTFQRRYKDDVGGSWIVTLVNHFSHTN